MQIKVERCANHFRLTLPCGSREFISYRDEDGWWNRSYASQALDLLIYNYGLKRSNIRFKHLN